MVTSAGELLAKVEQDPASLDGRERYILGLAVVGTSLDLQAQELSGSTGVDNTEAALESGIPLIISGLNAIRRDETMPEEMKLRFGLRVFKEINFDQLPDGEQKRILFVKTWLTIAAGLKTPIRQRIAELTKQWQDGNLKLGAAIRLGSKRNELTIGEQLDYLSKDLATIEAIDEEGKRKILIAWAKEIISGGDSVLEESSSELGEIIKFFHNRQDDEAANEVTEFFIGQSLVSFRSTIRSTIK